MQRRVEDVAALAAGAGDDQDVDALGDVARHRRRALARLVVGVGVHGHQPQPLATSREVRRGRRRQGHSGLQGTGAETLESPGSQPRAHGVPIPEVPWPRPR